MASPSRATLLFPREDRPSERSLESVGRLSVLEAMVEQRRQSSIPPPPPEADADDPEASGPRRVVEKKSLGFIKIR